MFKIDTFSCEDCDEYLHDFGDAVSHTISHPRHIVVLSVDDEQLRSYLVQRGLIERAAEDE